jgi:ABC-type transport system involved in multi-copper enzyme maturation permease subunit
MLLSLIAKEIAHNVLSLRFMVTFVLIFVLTMVSAFTMTRTYERALRIQEESTSTQRGMLSSIQGSVDQGDELHALVEGDGLFGFRPPNPFSVFVFGLEDRLATQVYATVWETREVEERRYENPLYRLFVTPDYAHIVNIVISLLALLFVFDSICGEKESGTLKILLSNSVPRDLVLLGKWIGGYLSLSVPLLAALLGGVTYVALAGAVQLDGPFLSRFGWVATLSLLYVSVFFALGMMISTVTHKASTALLVALSVWICWILVIPNLAPMLARIIAPVPTLQKLGAEKAAIDRETSARVERVQRSMLGYGREAARLQHELWQEANHRKAKIDEYYVDALQSQIDWNRNLARISPSGSFLFAATDLAGTGVELSSSFDQDVRRFGEELSAWVGEWHDAYHGRDGMHLEDGWLQLDAIPALRVHPTYLDDTLPTALTDILLLVVFNVLFFMLSYLFFLRYDVT